MDTLARNGIIELSTPLFIRCLVLEARVLSCFIDQGDDTKSPVNKARDQLS